MTSKVDGSLMMTKQSEHIITPFFSKYINTPSQVMATLEAILSVYLRDTNLETLPYVTGYCGEFCILQQAGPCQIPGMSESLQIFMYCYHYLSLISGSDTWGLFDNDNNHA